MLVYEPPPTREVADAWIVTKALILEVQREAQKHGAKFAMLFVNGPWAHYDWRPMTMNDKVAQDTWNRRTPNDTLAPFATEKNIPFVDLFPEFETKKAGQPLYFRFDPHWTPTGQRLAADTGARFLVDADLVPGP